jgi:serpin B
MKIRLLRLRPLCLSLLVALCLFPATPVRAEETAKEAWDPVSGNTAFACDLYGQLKARKGNLFFSPLCITLALTLPYAGAKGETAKQMKQALRFSAAGENPHASLAVLLSDIKANILLSGPNMRFRFANALWLQKDVSLLEPFREILEKYYDSSVFHVDFADDEQTAREKINAWAADATAGKITKIVDAGTLGSLTRLVLANAVYFKGSWSSPFPADNTEEDDFFTPAGKVKVPFMRQKDYFRYLETESLQILELPYGEGHASMLVLLPRKEPGSLAGLEKSLSPNNLARWREALAKEGERLSEVVVSLPKFTFSFGASLTPVLTALKMRDVFGAKADFSGMTEEQGIRIGDMLHKAYVEVNEEGTEAVAVTVDMATAAGPKPPAFVFTANRPFVFIIRENVTGSILFMGRLTNPQ